MVQTPWGELRVSDAHVHLFSHAFYSALARQKGADGAEALGPLLGWTIPDADPTSLADTWVAELDRHGIEHACLIASMHGDEQSVATAVARHPQRLSGYFMFDPTQADAPERIERAAGNPSLHAVCLFPAMHRYSITDSCVETVLQTSARHNLVVFVHCGTLSVGVRQKLGLTSPFDMRRSNPIDLHPVALRYPQMRFVIPHFGAGMFREALMLADLCPNVYFDTSSTNRWMRYEGLDLKTVFARSLDVLGPGRLLFGTDSSFFPRGWQPDVLAQQMAALTSIGIGPTQAEQIMGGNLRTILRGLSS